MKIMNMPGLRIAALLTVLSAMLLGCASDGSMSRTQKGAVIGGASGVALGGLMGSKRGNAGTGAVLGGVGGRYMDNQAKELEQVAETERVDDGIIVTMKDKILFDFNSSELKASSRASLQKMADVFKKYEKTNLTVTGHTDNVGSADYNLKLSERRAKAVADYLMTLGVPQGRMRIMGFGFERQGASNDSAGGRWLKKCSGAAFHERVTAYCRQLAGSTCRAAGTAFARSSLSAPLMPGLITSTGPVTG